MFVVEFRSNRAANGILKFHHSFPGREERTSRLFKDAELDGKLEIRDES